MVSRACVLSTKILSINQRQHLLQADISLIQKDFIEVSYKAFDYRLSNSWNIFTSKNAIEGAKQNPNWFEIAKKPTVCVGQRTKQILQENNVEVRACAPYVKQLMEIIKDKFSDKEFDYFGGNLETIPVVEVLKSLSVTCQKYQVYHTQLSPQKIETPVNGILFFSASAVKSYLLNNDFKANQTIFCIGTSTAAALDKDISSVVIASKQTIESVLVQCIKFYKQ